MGFWFVKARDVRVGDEVRVTVIGGQEFLTVLDVDTGGASERIAVHLAWGSHIPREPFWDDLDPNEQLVVRR